MAELAMRSGVTRETIHFYLREGLLPRPRKGGRTVAYYDEEHLQRLLTIRRLREEKYLPLAVIRRLLDSPAAEQDVDTLAEVLHILPAAPDHAPPAGPAVEEALSRGLLGPRREAEPGTAPTDPSEQRVIAIVDEAMRMEPAGKKLTLDDLQACAGDLSDLVAREAELFFDTVFETADIGGTIAALRAGRGTVARFITAYRDLMLRRIVEDLLLAIQHGSDMVARAATVPLSAHKERELGTTERRAALRAELSPPAPDAASRYVWHLFACGAASELAALPPEVARAAGARGAVLSAWGAYESARSAASMKALERAVEAAPDFALGRILLGEAILARGLRRPSADASFLERAVPALNRLLCSDPERDPEPVARALGYFHRGRVELALPLVLGRRARGAEALARAVSLVEDERHGQDIDPVGRARVMANARLALGRYHAAIGDVARARAMLESAAAIDPEGPIAEVVREEASPGKF